jgi:ATPase family associated with various cellular activities (AAA)/Winged helix domain, variant
MNDPREWQENNDRYLSAALAWLRLGLARMAETATSEKPIASKEEQPSGWFGARKRPAEGTEPVAMKETDGDIAGAAQAMADAARMEPPPALVILGQRFGLSDFEQEILLLCAAMELDTRIAALCGQAQDNLSRAYPTFALALTLFDNPAWDALSAEGPLRKWRLIEISQAGNTPLTMSVLRADERIVNYLKGLNQLDDRLTPLLAPFDVSDGSNELAASHRAVIETIEQGLKQWPANSPPPFVQLIGMDSISKQEVTLQVLSRIGWQGYRMPGELLPAAAGDLDTFARLWHRESILLPLALYIDVSDTDDGSQSADARIRLNRFLKRCGTLTFLDTREPRTGLGLDVLTFEIEKPMPAEQRMAWAQALGDVGGTNPDRLAGQFNFNLPTIRRVAGAVITGRGENESAESMEGRLWEACLGHSRPRLDRLAERIDPRATWKELVLPGEPLALLREITAQVRQRSKVYDDWGFRRKMSRGFGISALFAGESGTGKTMAAEVIANELRLNLYRIDLSAVVSKYIGETEKNLRRVFDAAEDGGVILFFDEADALFGKRSEVKDSHDRYANIEINYLLQRMEAYRGLAILATNMKSALDQAFMRRLRFIVNFPFPGLAERQAIWEGVYPKAGEEGKLPGTPVEAPDYNQLARLNLTGGSIHNIALNAAFRAAAAGKSVTVPLILEAARTEFRKLEKPVNESEFRAKTATGATP